MYQYAGAMCVWAVYECVCFMLLSVFLSRAGILCMYEWYFWCRWVVCEVCIVLCCSRSRWGSGFVMYVGCVCIYVHQWYIYECVYWWGMSVNVYITTLHPPSGRVHRCLERLQDALCTHTARDTGHLTHYGAEAGMCVCGCMCMDMHVCVRMCVCVWRCVCVRVSE
jgi:hypothetical protein